MLDAEGRVADLRAYVFAIIDAWRAAVKRRDIFANRGTRYGDPRRGMLDGATWQASKLVVCRALNRSLDVETEIAALSQLLDGAYRTVAERAASNAELRYRLGRRIHHVERGKIRSPLQQGQEEQLGALGLALNAVVHWNAIYMQEATRKVRLDGVDVSNDDIAHLSPLTWRHLNVLGRYDFSLPDTVVIGGLRPLRNLTSAWEF